MNTNPLSRSPVVLLADDDEDLLQLVKAKLEKEGFIVKISHNGHGILEIAERNKADIILLDVTMVGVDGRDICKLLKQHKSTSGIPIILFSGNDRLEEIAVSCGANDFVAKPFDLHLIKNKISHLLSNRSNA